MKNQATICKLIIALFCFFQALNAAPGDLDPTFSGSGRIIQRFNNGGYNDFSRASAVQPDGKILVAGQTQNGSFISCGIVRYNPNGALDSGFGSGGKAFVQITGFWSCRGMTVQADGKIIVVGLTGSENSDPTSGDFAVARLNQDGSLDNTFDGDGKVVYSISNLRDRANAAAIQPDGKIIVAGVSYNSATGWWKSDFAILRLNPNGSLDTAFGAGGIVKTTFSGYEDIANAVDVQADGKIVAAGKSYFDTFPDFALVRYNSDGTLDTTFDGDGKVVTDNLGSQSIIHDLAIQPDGKILAAGKSDDLTIHVTNLALVRYNADGSLDTTFDGDGIVIDPDYSGLNDPVGLTIQADGKIAAASGVALNNNSTRNFAVTRRNTNGSPDLTFDGDGKVLTPLSFSTNFATSALIQPDGKIVAVGDAYVSDEFNYFSSNFALARYNADGSLDPTFDGDGKTTTDVGITRSYASGVLIQPDGKVLAFGGAERSPSGDPVVVRYNENGTLDASFDGDGIAAPVFPGIVILATAGALQADGKIILAGYGSGAASDFAVIRLNPDGSPDTSFNGDGKVRTSLSADDDLAYAVAVQPDGKIVAAGYRRSGQALDFALVRYNTDGSLDTTFDGDGIVTTAFSGLETANAVIIQSDGKIIAAGTSYTGNLAAARYLANGSLDTTFDGDGKLTLALLTSARSAAIQPDGKILIAGSRFSGANRHFGIARINPNGSADIGFGSGGAVITPVSNGTYEVQSVAIQPDGKIVASGYGEEFVLESDFALVRYHPNGSLDGSYGKGGIVRFNILDGGSRDELYGMALDSLGRAVVGGNSNGFFTVARILGDIQPVVNYSVGGRVVLGKNSIANVYVTLTDSNGATHSARTNSFGYYRFTDIPAGKAVVSVSSKRYSFENPTQNINLTSNIGDLDFEAIE